MAVHHGIRRGAAALALALSGALLLSSCSPDAGLVPAAAHPEPPRVSGEYALALPAPTAALLPADVVAPSDRAIAENLYAQLVTVDTEGAVSADLAEWIRSEDRQTYEIRVARDHKFADGEAITAESFVAAWREAAAEKNHHPAAYVFADIRGFGFEPGSELTGLTVLDEYTFRVELTRPVFDFVYRLSQLAFSPLPSEALKDPAAFARAPRGNGPFIVEPTPDSGALTLLANENYRGPRPPAQKRIIVDVAEGPEAALAAIEAGTVSAAIPVPDRSLETLVIPRRLEHFDGEEGRLRRAAISLALDREALSAQIEDSIATPATSFTVPGSVAGNPLADLLPEAENPLRHDPERAAALWREADALNPWSGTLTLAVNRDGGHAGWGTAAAAQIGQALGINAEAQVLDNFLGLRAGINDRSRPSAFRVGWGVDYPAAADVLDAQYSTGGPSNDGNYSEPALDEALRELGQAPDLGAATAAADRAQKILARDLPAVPLWVRAPHVLLAPGAAEVPVGWNGTPRLDLIGAPATGAK
ncbi:ABC transporter substrate-binding protein [Mycetocola spongiae]|uniref:ABC transporter substrate-binding protein n=1 Tax=Mycetocola spongiae TaxID=2859226 RepID=UPI001CF1920A|nr:ABC transporter substrate-binding protein [Mycetocola spongiae]UCR89019.1 ABC transporter substrate-binding protein [Mycetocola spongiae]